MAEFDCKKCLHEKVCALWTEHECQDASCFCREGCDYFAPTLTQPNEALTCEGCIHEHNEHENCNYCKRASYLGDYYYRRPPEGEEDK